MCRLGRSLPDLIGLLGELRSRDIDLYFHALDTSTPLVEPLVGMLVVFREFEGAIQGDGAAAEGQPGQGE